MKPFNEGKRDFKVGQLINPYNEGTSRYREWERGFNKEYFINLERITNDNKEKDYKKGYRKTSE